jgi:hypothetical protein
MGSLLLSSLRGKLIALIEPDHWRVVTTLDEAQGVQFLCPLCYTRNAGPVGTHSIICWSRSRGVPDDQDPLPGRWTLSGSGVHDLHLDGDPVGGARSIQLTGGCAWHGFINHGRVEEGF